MANELVETNVLNQSLIRDSTKTLINPAKEDGNLADIKTLITNQNDATQIYIGGGWRTISSVAFDVNATTTTVIAAVANKKIYIVGIEVVVDTDGTTFKLTESGVGDLHAAQTFMKGGGKVNNPSNRVLWQTTTPNTALNITTTVGKATGTLYYTQF